MFVLFTVKIDATDLLAAPKETTAVQETVERTTAAPSVVMKKERSYRGMFEYRREDERVIIQNLIIGMI